MPLLSKFIDSLSVKYYRSGYREVLTPVALNGTTEDRNVLVCLNKGHMFVGRDKEEVLMQPGTFWFFPAGHEIFVKHGKGRHYVELGREGFRDAAHRESYLRTISGLDDFSRMKEVWSILSFDVQLYSAIPFFNTLDMPPFPLPADTEMFYLIRHICLEAEQNKLGRDLIINNYMQEAVVHLMRYIDSQPHLRTYVERLSYLTDKRLVEVVRYIQNNMDKDLRNKAISKIAYMSEDYVGQFFKSLTGKNLQDYIENQRLERAMYLLKTTPDNIQEISHKVGFKDPAYFSRRFKLKYNLNAHSVRSIKHNFV